MSTDVLGTLKDKFNSINVPFSKWKNFSSTKLFKKLLGFYPADPSISQLSLDDLLTDFHYDVCLNDDSVVIKTHNRLRNIQSSVSEATWRENEASTVKFLVTKSLGKGDSVAKAIARSLGLNDASKLPPNVDALRALVVRELSKMQADVRRVSSFATISVGKHIIGAPPKDSTASTHGNSKTKGNRSSQAKGNLNGTTPGASKRVFNCHACGHDGHLPTKCPFLHNKSGKHPDANLDTKTPWSESDKGKE
jgi:hypothetical protein